MKKYFVTSDIHSYFNEWMIALNNSGFDINNPEHFLVVVGDLFDHGDQTKECYDFVNLIHSKNRLIYIKGNHEHSWLEAINMQLPDQKTFSDGTVKSFCHLANIPADTWKNHNQLTKSQMIYIWHDIVNKVTQSGIIDFIKDNTINFIEIKNFIICHSFYPLKWKINNPTIELLKSTDKVQCEYDPNWRTNNNDFEWYAATWQNALNQYNWGNFEQEELKGKKLICGHWGNPELYNIINKVNENHPEILYYKNMICIDAKTKNTRVVNCYIIEE